MTNAVKILLGIAVLLVILLLIKAWISRSRKVTFEDGNKIEFKTPNSAEQKEIIAKLIKQFNRFAGNSSTDAPPPSKKRKNR